ncbi:MAG TPA: alpha/beta hydrolase [bacterium]|nr:alpha/beta hydrolase [bacterium]
MDAFLQNERSVKHHGPSEETAGFHYITLGEGPLVILVHGWNNNWYGFWPLIEQLSGCRVMSVDQLGYGTSANLASAYSVEAMADRLADLVRTLPDTYKCIGGLSLGSAVVARFAQKHGDLVQGAFLMGPPILKKKSIGSGFFRRMMRLIDRHRWMYPVGKRLISSAPYSHMTARFLNMYRYDRRLISRYGLSGRKQVRGDALFQMGKSVGNFDLAAAIEHTHIPLRIIYGKHDKLVDHARAQELARHQANLQLVYIEKAGHVVCLEKPSETADAIRSFLQDLQFPFQDV